MPDDNFKSPEIYDLAIRIGVNLRARCSAAWRARRCQGAARRGLVRLGAKRLTTPCAPRRPRRFKAGPGACEFPDHTPASAGPKPAAARRISSRLAVRHRQRLTVRRRRYGRSPKQQLDMHVGNMGHGDPRRRLSYAWVLPAALTSAVRAASGSERSRHVENRSGRNGRVWPHAERAEQIPPGPRLAPCFSAIWPARHGGAGYGNSDKHAAYV